jgi:hypothetical protein
VPDQKEPAGPGMFKALSTRRPGTSAYCEIAKEKEEKSKACVSHMLLLPCGEDIGELMRLGGFPPICSKCKKIKTSDNSWELVERFIRMHTVEVDFTHGLCPTRLRETFPGRTAEKRHSQPEAHRCPRFFPKSF